MADKATASSPDQAWWCPRTAPHGRKSAMRRTECEPAAQKVFHHLWRGPATAAAVLVVLASRTTTIAASKLGGGLPLSVDHAPCVRLFHAGGDVGCRSPDRGGVDGPLVLVDSETVLDAIESTADKEALALPGMGSGGFVAVLPGAMFDSATLKRLSATKFLGGVLLLEDEGEDGADDVVTLSPAVAVTENGQAAGRVNDQWYSPDVTTPQGDSTPTTVFDVDASYPWNSHGDGLLMESLIFPVAMVTGASRDEVRSRAASNGALGGVDWKYPLHTASMNFYFGGSGMDLNSQACLEWTDIDGKRDPQCLPLGGQSSWASMGPPGMGDERETVFVTAAMDSTSIFHDRAPGGNSAVSGLVALLAAAESLGAAGRSGSTDFSVLPRQMVFAAFQAEAYGFTGSRRFLQDWQTGVTCHNTVDASDSPSGADACLDPLYPSLEFQNLGKPAHVLSVDQVGCLPESTLWIHPSAEASAADQGMLSGLSPVGDGGVALANATRKELPPSPLTAFVKAESRQSGFVISGYDETFSCPHYHSHRDTRAGVDERSVAAAGEMLAKSTFLLAGGAEAEAQALQVNVTLVATLLDCLLENWACDIVSDYVVGELTNLKNRLGFRVSVDPPFPPSAYTGPLEFRYGGGLPTIRHTNKDGSWRLHSTWKDDFDPVNDKIQLVPSLLEIFTRAFLSEQIGSAYAGEYGESECASSADCPVPEREQKWHKIGDPPEAIPRDTSDARSSPGASSPSVPFPECVRGRCSETRGFHHIALGVGLEREDEVNQYRVVPGAVKQGAPLWTEVNWQSIGVKVYLNPGDVVGQVAVGVGAIFTAMAGVASWALFRSLSAQNLL